MKYKEISKLPIYGNRIAISDNGLIMVATTEGCYPKDDTSIKVYRRDTISNEWVLDSTVNNHLKDEFYGSSLALAQNGNVLVIGSTSRLYNYNGGENKKSGSVYTYTRNTITDRWDLISVLKENMTLDNSHYGNNVLLSEDGLSLIVSNYSSVISGKDTGLIYTYTRKSIYDTHWNRLTTINLGTIEDNYLDYAPVIYGDIDMSKDGLSMYIATLMHADNSGELKLYITEYTRTTTTEDWSFSARYILKNDVGDKYVYNRIRTLENGNMFLATHYNTSDTQTMLLYKWNNVKIEPVNITITTNEKILDIYDIAISKEGIVVIAASVISNRTCNSIDKVITYKNVT